MFFRIQTKYGEIPYLSVFSPNAGKHGLEKLRNTGTFHTVYHQLTNILLVIW